MSAEQILAELKGRSQVSKATVYNSLKLFAEQGLIRQVNVHSERLIYDSNMRPHHHFYNVDTGQLTDLDPEHVELLRVPQPPEGTIAEGVEIVIKVRNARRN
jgi:Fur family iron response transcriptional regulator